MEWAFEGGPNGILSRRAGGELRYQSRRMLVRAKWALFQRQAGWHRRSLSRFCPSVNARDRGAFVFLSRQTERSNTHERIQNPLQNLPV